MSAVPPPDEAPPSRPASWRPWLVAAVALLSLLFACFADSVGGRVAIDGAGRLTRIDALYEPLGPARLGTISDPSTETLHQPWDAWIIQTMKGGELPLWLPHNGLGAPILANGQAAAFSPYKWLTLSSSDGTWSTGFVLGRLALAGAGVLVLARCYGLSPLAGLLAACAFMLHGFFLHHLRFPDVHVYAFMPWVLLAAERLRRTPDARGLGLMGLAIGVTGLLGHPEPALYVATGAGLVYAATSVAAGAQLGRRALAMALAVCLGALLNMAVLLPFAEFVHDSRSYLFEDRQYLGLSFRHMLVFSISHLFIPDGPRYVYEHFVGIVPLALAFLGLGRSAARIPGLVLLGTGLLAYLLLPPANLLPAPAVSPNSFYAPPLIALGLTLLAGAGLDALLAAPRARSVLAVAAGLGAAALFVAYYQWIAPVQTFGQVGAALPFLLAVAALFAVQRWGAWPRPMLAGVLLGLTALTSGLAVQAVVKPLPPFRYPETPILTHLKSQPGHFRVVGGFGALRPDSNLMHGITSAEHSDAFYFRRYADFWAAVARRADTEGYQPDLLDLANVRYLAVARKHRGANLRHQVSQDPERYPLRIEQPLASLHENLTALPRARVLHAAEFVPLGSAEALRRLEGRPAAWRTKALVETPDGRPPAGWRDRADAATPVVVARYEPQHVELTTQPDHPGLLVLADMYARGWTAEVDGRPAEIYPVAVAFRGVFLDAGAHRVVFRYRPPSVPLGLAISLVALLLCLTAIALPRPSPRGSHAAADRPTAGR